MLSELLIMCLLWLSGATFSGLWRYLQGLRAQRNDAELFIYCFDTWKLSPLSIGVFWGCDFMDVTGQITMFILKNP